MLGRLAALLVVTTVGLQTVSPPPDPPAKTLQLAFNADGTVSLLAKGVSTSEILAEWKRLCVCAVVNGERLRGGPLLVPLAFSNASQQSVLAALLRDAAGYTLTPRRAGAPGPSEYETVYILATSSSTSPGFAVTPTPVVTPDDGKPGPQVPVSPDEIPFVWTPSGRGNAPPPTSAPGPGVYRTTPAAPAAPKGTQPDRSGTPPTTGRGSR